MPIALKKMVPKLSRNMLLVLSLVLSRFGVSTVVAALKERTSDSGRVAVPVKLLHPCDKEGTRRCCVQDTTAALFLGRTAFLTTDRSIILLEACKLFIMVNWFHSVVLSLVEQCVEILAPGNKY